MSGEENFRKQDGKKKKNRRPAKKHNDDHGDHHNENSFGTRPEPAFVRKQVDPELTTYFAEIANAIEGSEVEYEQRLLICGNALEEARGKELELATDYIISHTLQDLIKGCDVFHLCAFLRSCAQDFPIIAMDRSGSHVAETVLKYLNMHMQDEDAHIVIEETLTKICEVIVVKPLDVMCNPYGSHVLRSLLCICKGIPLDFSEEFHVTKSATTLAERLNMKESNPGLDISQHAHQSFPHLLIFLVKEMLKHGREDIATLQVDQYSSLVLQVILEVAPEDLYNEIFTKIFRKSLFKISSDHCGSFVIQALVSSPRCQGQMDLIWDELGGNFKDLLENGKAGVIASLLAACQRLHKHERECSESLVGAVCLPTESPSFVVPRILFLESYLWSEDKSNWKWASGERMHVLGCLMLQTIFKYPSEFIQSYAMSILSMEAEYALETAKDAGGGRVIESFLCSDASARQKRKFIAKLQGHFGELSMHPSGSYTVEKCFSASNSSLKETIVSELLAVRPELSKTKQGPYLSKKLDIDGYATRPDQWKSRQESREKTHKEYYSIFGSGKTESSKRKSFSATEPPSDQQLPKGVKKVKQEMDQFLASSGTSSDIMKRKDNGKGKIRKAGRA
ncbi:hypothetical protein IFM89_026111 [Coptis chinensis]|uniref:Uncharacterized protein n=1 Tax=Coptis chinensis TaxID=261450 RepID=A0A835IDQ4_9MAGN|nr:hypothetical protein IFM89_026111 [Coptis chinensis]